MKMSFFHSKRIMMTVCLAVLDAALPGSAQGQTSQADNPDWPARSSAIHWPEGFMPSDADLFAHNELVIHAPCSVLWAHLIRASTWPTWYSNSHHVHLLNSPDGNLHPDASFSWDTFGVHVESHVHESVPMSRIGWFGNGTGTKAYHTFLLETAPSGCHVVTEEVVKGPGAVESRQKNPEGMHRGHDLCLASLKKISESEAD